MEPKQRKLKTKKADHMQDFKSILQAHTLDYWDSYDDYTYIIIWSKGFQFLGSHNLVKSIKLFGKTQILYLGQTKTSIP